MKRLIGGLAFLLLSSWLGAGGPLAHDGQLITIGILSFQDDSSAHVSAEFLQRAAQEFKQQLASSFKDVLPRPLSGEMPGAPATMSIEQLAALGHQQGVRFVVRGGLLAAVSEKRGNDLDCRLEFYCDLIEVEGLAVSSFRAEGSGTEKDSSLANAFKWDSINWDSPEFTRSALGQALVSALVSLVEQVHEAAVANPPQVKAEAAWEEPAAPAENTPVDPYQLDQDLQQVIAQAESLISGGAASSLGDTAPLQRSLEGLLSAMDSKLRLLEEAQDTSAIDTEIRQRQGELQDIVNAYTQQLASEPPPVYAQDVPAEKNALTSTIKELLQSALTTLFNIQDIRAALGLQAEGAQDAYPVADEYADEGAGEYAFSDEQTSEISGVVIDEAGNPVEGATVLESETGADAVTDETGSYTITGVPGGRIATLRVVKGGRTLASGRVDVPPGGAGIADWQVRAGAGGSSPSANRIMPSSLIAKTPGSRSKAGAIQGIVLDDQGQAVPRALVSVKGVGAVRTDSKGRYAFVHVPQGTHELSVQRSGSTPLTQNIKLVGLQTLRPRTICKKTVLPPGEKPSGRILVRGENTLVKGRVVDKSGKAIARSKVTIIYPGGALVAYSNDRGGYEVRNLKQGTYRVLAAKSGYADSAATLEVKKNGTVVRDFKLSESSSSAVRKAVASRNRPRPNSATRAADVSIPVLERTPPPRDKSAPKPKDKSTPIPPKGTENSRGSQSTSKSTKNISAKTGQVQAEAALGGVRVTVVDGKTGKAVSGATVLLKGKPSAKTDASGQIHLGDLKPGTYSVNVRKAGFENGGGSFTVKPRGTASCRIRLSPLSTAKPATTTVRKR